MQGVDRRCGVDRRMHRHSGVLLTQVPHKTLLISSLAERGYMHRSKLDNQLQPIRSSSFLHCLHCD